MTFYFFDDNYYYFFFLEITQNKIKRSSIIADNYIISTQFYHFPLISVNTRLRIPFLFTCIINLICLTTKFCQVWFPKRSLRPVNRRYGNSSSHMRSHMLTLCVTIENDINPVSVLVFFAFGLLENTRTELRRSCY